MKINSDVLPSVRGFFLPAILLGFLILADFTFNYFLLLLFFIIILIIYLVRDLSGFLRIRFSGSFSFFLITRGHLGITLTLSSLVFLSRSH